MSENTITASTPNKAPRLLKNRDKVIVGVVVALIAATMAFGHWFASLTGSDPLKWALVGSTTGYVITAVLVFLAMVLVAVHFAREPGSMKTTTWILLLILYIGGGIGAFFAKEYFKDLSLSYNSQINILSVCREDGMSADECAGVVANLGVEKDR